MLCEYPQSGEGTVLPRLCLMAFQEVRSMDVNRHGQGSSTPLAVLGQRLLCFSARSHCALELSLPAVRLERKHPVLHPHGHSFLIRMWYHTYLQNKRRRCQPCIHPPFVALPAPHSSCA